jgi:phosphoribosylamine--glycine ligase
MLRLQSDLVALCNAAIDQRLDQSEARWDPRPSLGVVLAAGGYPEGYNKGDRISGLPTVESAEQKVFHAGTAEQDGEVVTAGGRVLCACALGDTVADAQQRAYALTRQINWDGVYFRTDIGHRAIAREQ